MAAERNKARVLELIDRVTNGHDLTALEEFTSNPAVVGSARGLLQAFPDLRADVRWIVAADDMVVCSFMTSEERRQAPGCLFVNPGRPVQTSFMLAFKFDDAGQVIDQWLGSNLVEMLAQLGWGFAPLGAPAAPSG
jgi:predicted ester cyclase